MRGKMAFAVILAVLAGGAAVVAYVSVRRTPETAPPIAAEARRSTSGPVPAPADGAPPEPGNRQPGPLAPDTGKDGSATESAASKSGVPASDGAKWPVSGGSQVEMERFLERLERSAREWGVTLPPMPELPYKPRALEIYKRIESMGYKREELYEYYAPVFGRDFSMADVRAAEQTYRLSMLFYSKDRQAIEREIEERLKKNPGDVLALFARLDLHSATVEVDAAFEDIHALLDAVEKTEFKGVDKRAVLYRIMSAGDIYGNRTSVRIEERRNRVMTDKSFLMPSAQLLTALELAGNW